MSHHPTVRKVSLPSDALAATVFARLDYVDSYRVRIPNGFPHDVASITRAFVSTRIGWIDALVWLRDRLVSIVQLKSEHSGGNRPITLEPGSYAGIFRVYQLAADEILLGEDDRHLDFRISILVQQQGNVCWAIISTVVRYNNLLGRLYFLPVRPFHQLIVRAMMQQMFDAPSTVIAK